jgi:predicted ATPase
MQLCLLGECLARVDKALVALDRGVAHGPRTEMLLWAALGMSTMYTRGPVDETASTWTRVLELAEGMDESEYQLRALYGLWLYRVLVCEYRAAVALAKQFQLVAKRGAATTDTAMADRMMAIALHYLGDQAGTRACAERSLSAPVPANRHVHTIHYGVDQRVGALVLLSRALWLQGFADQPIQTAQAGADEALKVGHANSVCLALADGAGLIAILADNVWGTAHFRAMLIEHAEKHSLGVWRTYGVAVRGRLLMGRDAACEGVALLRSALADLRETLFDIRFQLYLVWLAETLGRSGQVVEALAAIDEALERAERTEERWYLPELLRLRGEQVLQAGAPGSAAVASECFAQSLHWARKQKALSWELRTTMSLVRSRLAETSTVGLPTLLGSVLGRFSEGFETADLIAARRLSTELVG